MSERIRCGRAKVKQTKKGQLIKLMINLDTLTAAFDEHGFTGDHGRMIPIDMWPTPDSPYNNSHDVMVDTWKPDPNYQQNGQNPQAPAQQAPAPQAPQPAKGNESDSIDDVPF